VVINSNLSCGTCQYFLAGFDNRYIFAKHLSLIGSTMGTHHDFRTVMELVFSGRLNPILDQTYPLSEAGAAQQRLARGEQMGKITLAID
jgi:threonine dehydrogenase-like Zn-dependent dehydrogenase